MTNKINQMLVENEENLRYFEQERRDHMKGVSAKKWWQNYLLCFIFYFLLGGFMVGFSMGVWIPDQGNDEKTFGGNVLGHKVAGWKGDFGNVRRERVVEIEIPFDNPDVQVLLADKDLFARVKKEEGSLVAKRENNAVTTVAAARAPKIRAQ